MIELNDENHASEITFRYAKSVLGKFDEHIYGCEMGIAYGGGVEKIGREWGKKGDIWGFDTFEGHPKHLAVDKADREATCMEIHYANFGTKELSLEYQQSQLDGHGLHNVHLVKGEINKDSLKDIPKLHYAFLDMDILSSMKTGYELVRDKIEMDGYLLMHDVTSKTNLPLLWKWFYDDILYRDRKMWFIEGIWPNKMLAVLKRMDI